MALGKFIGRIKEEAVGPAVAGATALRSGMIIASYYGAIESGVRSSQNMYVDVVFLDGDGKIQETIGGIPMMRIGGISPSLPPVGAIGIVGYVGGRAGTKYLLGFYESDLSDGRTEDDMAPQVPPTLKTR
jgi:hypothetical protein